MMMMMRYRGWRREDERLSLPPSLGEKKKMPRERKRRKRRRRKRRRRKKWRKRWWRRTR